jgi:hypothetical protein
VPKRQGNQVVSDIRALRQQLSTFDRSLRRLVPLLSAVEKDGAQAEKLRRRPRLSAKAHVSLVLQGRYMGYMRQLKPMQKAQVRKVREVKGVRAAIARAKEIARP